MFGVLRQKGLPAINGQSDRAPGLEVCRVSIGRHRGLIRFFLPAYMRHLCQWQAQQHAQTQQAIPMALCCLCHEGPADWNQLPFHKPAPMQTAKISKVPTRAEKIPETDILAVH